MGLWHGKSVGPIWGLQSFIHLSGSYLHQTGRTNMDRTALHIVRKKYPFRTFGVVMFVTLIITSKQVHLCRHVSCEWTSTPQNLMLKQMVNSWKGCNAAVLLPQTSTATPWGMYVCVKRCSLVMIPCDLKCSKGQHARQLFLNGTAAWIWMEQNQFLWQGYRKVFQVCFGMVWLVLMSWSLK